MSGTQLKRDDGWQLVEGRLRDWCGRGRLCIDTGEEIVDLARVGDDVSLMLPSKEEDEK